MGWARKGSQRKSFTKTQRQALVLCPCHLKLGHSLPVPWMLSLTQFLRASAIRGRLPAGTTIQLSHRAPGLEFLAKEPHGLAALRQEGRPAGSWAMKFGALAQVMASVE